MATDKLKIEDEGIDEAECLECGIRLEAEEIADVDGETLCGQCAEDYLRELETHEPTASHDDMPERGARLH